MGQITANNKKGRPETVNGRFFVDAEGNFLGEYFFDGDGKPLTGCMPKPPAAIEVFKQPDSYRQIWNSNTGTWSDPVRSAKELHRESKRQAEEAKKAAAIAKLERMGITVDDIKAALGNASIFNVRAPNTDGLSD